MDNTTKATVLNYPNQGNGTVDQEWCDDTEMSFNTAPQGGRKRASRHKRENRLQRREPTSPYEEKMRWNKEELPHDEKAPPVTILPDGARHEFDPKENYVSWSTFHHGKSR